MSERSPRPRRQPPWRNDPKVLERLEAEGQALRMSPTQAIAKKVILARYQISERTWASDMQRIRELWREQSSQTFEAYVAQSNQWLLEVVHDSDVAIAQSISAQARAMHIANKVKAIDVFNRLHGLEKPVEIAVTVDSVLRVVRLEDTAPLTPEALAMLGLGPGPDDDDAIDV